MIREIFVQAIKLANIIFFRMIFSANWSKDEKSIYINILLLLLLFLRTIDTITSNIVLPNTHSPASFINLQ